MSTSELGAVLADAAAGCSSFLAAPAGAFLGCTKRSFLRTEHQVLMASGARSRSDLKGKQQNRDAHLGDHDDHKVLIADLVVFERSIILKHLDARILSSAIVHNLSRC